MESSCLAKCLAESVAGIIMVEPGPFVCSPGLRAGIEAIAASIEAGDQEPRRQFITNNLFLPTSDPMLVEDVRRVMMEAPTHVAASGLRGILAFDGPVFAAQCEVPALHLTGASPFNPPHLMSQWLRCGDRSRFSLRFWSCRVRHRRRASPANVERVVMRPVIRAVEQGPGVDPEARALGRLAVQDPSCELLCRSRVRWLDVLGVPGRSSSDRTSARVQPVAGSWPHQAARRGQCADPLPLWSPGRD